jgi:hypothetical protein
MTMKRFMAILGVAVLGAVLAWSTGCDDGNSDDSVKVTLEEYNEISVGMTLDQVVAIIGGSPTRSGSATGPYANTGTAYQWVNPDGSAALITFENDEVVAKSQVNLT